MGSGYGFNARIEAEVAKKLYITKITERFQDHLKEEGNRIIRAVFEPRGWIKKDEQIFSSPYHFYECKDRVPTTLL